MNEYTSPFRPKKETNPLRTVYIFSYIKYVDSSPLMVVMLVTVATHVPNRKNAMLLIC